MAEGWFVPAEDADGKDLEAAAAVLICKGIV